MHDETTFYLARQLTSILGGFYLDCPGQAMYIRDRVQLIMVIAINYSHRLSGPMPSLAL